MDISIWEWLKAHDVYTWLEPLWQNGNWYLNDEGKLQIKNHHIAIETPWVHHGHAEWARCTMWSRIMFYAASLNINKHFADMQPFVPSGCQNCYKVVVRPRTVVELFHLDEIETNMGRPSKCGIEMRDTVNGLYGGYFYNQGLNAGLECYEAVKQEVPKGIPIILKRGCTEMEHAVGPSDKWEVTDEQRAIEELILEWVVEPKKHENDQPGPVVWRTKRKWIDYAYQHGDQTYLELTDNKLIVPGYVTYHGD